MIFTIAAFVGGVFVGGTYQSVYGYVVRAIDYVRGMFRK